MESESCRLCGSTSREPILEGSDRLHALPGLFRLARCGACGLIFQCPRLSPQALATHYPSDYLPFQIAVEDEAGLGRRWDRRYGLRKRRRLISSLCPRPGRLLDFGCATGVFLDHMRGHGWTAVGVEPNSYAAGYAESRFHLRVHSAPVAQDSFPERSFDVITLWDVLEHLSDPLFTLECLSVWLKPKGYLVLSLPNPDSWERRLFGRCWIGWDLPRHLFLFPRNTLSLLLQKSGLQIKRTLIISGRYHTFLLSLDLWLQEKRFSPRVAALLLSILRSWPWRLPGLFLFKLSDRWAPSTCLTVIAQGKNA